MDDKTATLSGLKEQVLDFARERDWEQFHSPKNLSMALAAEAAELMEPFLWMQSEESCDLDAKPGLRQQVEEEVADVVIYALEFANIAKIDLATAIAKKLEQNAAKYPVEKARGRSDKYDKL
jgi:dCTP diphosphatase